MISFFTNRQRLFRFLFWGVILVLMAVSSIPGSAVNKTLQTHYMGIRLDYLLHFGAYAVIGVLGGLAYRIHFKLVLLLLLFAAVEEGHQYWIPARTFNPVDYLFDVLGIVVGLGVVYSLQRKKQYRIDKTPQ